jgi:hypothetical protein
MTVWRFRILSLPVSDWLLKSLDYTKVLSIVKSYENLKFLSTVLLVDILRVIMFHLQRPSYTQGTRIYVQTALLDLILNTLRQWQCVPDESHIGRFGTDDGPRKRWAGICPSLNIISWRKVIFVKLSIPTLIKKVKCLRVTKRSSRQNFRKGLFFCLEYLIYHDLYQLTSGYKRKFCRAFGQVIRF